MLITYHFFIGKILLKNHQKYIYLHTSIHNRPLEKYKHCTLCRVDNSYFVLTSVECYIIYTCIEYYFIEYLCTINF